MILSDIFNSLEKPMENDNFQFSANLIPEFHNHRIAKDRLGNPVLLISVLNSSIRIHNSNIKLQNVSAVFDINCIIQQDKTVIQKPFTILSFTGDDPILIEYFLKLCDSLLRELGQLPTQEVVRLSILSFIELLRFTTELPTKTVQGLWSELFIILNAKDPISLMRYWHQTPEEKFDFSDGEDKLEVKSTTSDLRIHSFSLEQLNPSPQTQIYIASLILRYYSEGESIEDLRYRLEKLFFDNKELINKLRFQIAQTLGRSITDTFSIKFDVQLAITSLRYFKATDLPRILLTIVPQYVSDVHFKSDLTNIQPTDLSNLTSKSNLINSII